MNNEFFRRMFLGFFGALRRDLGAYTPKKPKGRVFDPAKWIKSAARLKFERDYQANPMNRVPGRINVRIMQMFGNDGDYRRRQGTMQIMAGRYLDGSWRP